MWIMRQRSVARPKPPVELEALEVRLLLATVPAGSSPNAADDAAQVTNLTAGRTDDYTLASSDQTPEVRFQVQFNAADPTKGHLVLTVPSSATQVIWDFDAKNGSSYGGSVPLATLNGSTSGKALLVQFLITPPDASDSESGSGTYNLALSWVDSSTPASQLPPSISAPGSVSPSPGNTASLTAGETYTPPGTTNSPSNTSADAAGGTSGVPNPTADTTTPVPQASFTIVPTGLGYGPVVFPLPTVVPAPLPSLQVQDKPLPVAVVPSPTTGGLAVPPPSSQLPVTNSPASSTPPSVTTPIGIGLTPVNVGSVPVTIGTPGIFGPFLPAPSAGGLGGPGLEPHGEGRGSGAVAQPWGAGPSLIVGPLPLSRSDPDGGVFTRSSTSTVNPTGAAGTDAALTTASSSSNVPQASAEVFRWSSSLVASSPDDWLTPFGVEWDPAGRPVTPPSPLAAADPSGAQREGAVLLPAVAAEVPPVDPAADPAGAIVAPVLVLAAPPEPIVAEDRPSIPPPESGVAAEVSTERDRSRPWTWQVVTLSALTATAVMIFRLHAPARMAAAED